MKKKEKKESRLEKVPPPKSGPYLGLQKSAFGSFWSLRSNLIGFLPLPSVNEKIKDPGAAFHELLESQETEAKPPKMWPFFNLTKVTVDPLLSHFWWNACGVYPSLFPSKRSSYLLFILPNQFGWPNGGMDPHSKVIGNDLIWLVSSLNLIARFIFPSFSDRIVTPYFPFPESTIETLIDTFSFSFWN